MINETQLRLHLIKLIEGKLTLDEFEDQFVSASWNMHQDSSTSAIALASAVELRLAEHSSGHLDEPGLRKELFGLVSGSIFNLASDIAGTMKSDSSIQFIDWVWQQSPAGPFADKRSEMVCG